MKSLLLITTIILFAACHKQDRTINMPSPLLGRWVLAEDSSISFDLRSISDTGAFVVYPHRIADPMPGAVGVSYQYTTIGDTVILYNAGIYPNLKFYLYQHKYRGLMYEYRFIPSQGSYKPIIQK